MMRGLVQLIGVVGAVLVSCVVVAIPVATQSGPVTLAVAGRASANASLASSGSFVGVAWAARTKDGVTDVYAATSRDGARTFSAPVRVNHVPGDVSVSGEQPPRVVLTDRERSTPTIVVLWTAKAPSGTRLVWARSGDGGRSFGPAEAVPGSSATGNRGWEAATVTPKGNVVAVWLDHREVPARTAGANGEHQHGAASRRSPAEGVARAQLSQIFFARLNEPASVRAIAPGVCYCCKTSIAAGAEDTIVAAWRHVYPGNIRDIALATSTDGGRTFTPPIRVSEDNWVLDGCPENGPAVAIDRANAIHVVWPTLIRGESGVEENLALYYAVSKDGQRFARRQRIPTEGVPRHPELAIGADGAVTIAWDEQVRTGRRVVVARGTSGAGNGLRVVRVPAGTRQGTYPAVAVLADAAVVAWVSGPADAAALRVERLPILR